MILKAVALLKFGLASLALCLSLDSKLAGAGPITGHYSLEMVVGLRRGHVS